MYHIIVNGNKTNIIFLLHFICFSDKITVLMTTQGGE